MRKLKIIENYRNYDVKNVLCIQSNIDMFCKSEILEDETDQGQENTEFLTTDCSDPPPNT